MKQSRFKPYRRIAHLLCAALLGAALLLNSSSKASAEDGPATRTETFDRNPNWDGHNNRSNNRKPVKVVQDFGYSATAHAGGKPGEIGGVISPDDTAAYYAKVIPEHTLDDVLAASGKLNVVESERSILLGFFNAQTVNEWRTPNTIALRFVQHRGEGYFFNVLIEYGTRRWRAGGAGFLEDPGSENFNENLVEFPVGKVYSWSLKYDPNGNNGGGTITATINDRTVVATLDPGHKADGATFNRFGLLNAVMGGHKTGTLWVDDLTINGQTSTFDTDPTWDQLRNRSTHVTSYVRPRFDFGYSPTHYAGGKAPGEMGGLIFRGDERYPDRMAYYGDRLEKLTLEKPLKASGKMSFRHGVTDSSTQIGFFHSTDSMKQSTAQTSGFPENFLGIAIEGPSSDGFLFYPVYTVNAPDQPGGSGQRADPPPSYIYPDGEAHEWTLDYQPVAEDGKARITVTLDGKAVSIELAPKDKAIGAHFDRFGIITTHTDGNGQKVFYDDLTYTVRQ